MKNMLEILKDTLQDGVEIVRCSRSEIDVYRKAIDNAISTMYINTGILGEANSWLGGEKRILAKI